ncbi:MAG: BamA/TamA family outer membrane protein [Bacteroidia bacterium]
MTPGTRNIRIILIALMPLIFFACNPARKLQKGEYLLQRNHVIDRDTKVDKSDIEGYIKQKPNRRILLIFRFHLWLHNLANEERIKRKRILYDKKVERRNNRRIARGKKPKTSQRQLFGEWLLNVSEPPVIYDSLLSKKSAKQIKLFLNNKGYFISSVKDSVVFGRTKRCSVYYTIHAEKPYTVSTIEYKIPDELLKYYILSDTSNCLIKPGANYDVDLMQRERERITSELNNNGYFLFTKDYIYYEVDSTLKSHEMNITLGVKNYAYKYSDYSDSIVERPHQRFYINNVYIQPDFTNKKIDASLHKDTIKADDYFILHTAPMRFKTRVLLNSVFIRKSELYQQANVDDTYKRLSELKSFKSIGINFEKAGGDYLDCYISLSPIPKQSFTVETEGTNTGAGNLGISGSIVYQNRNLFKGAEVLELRLKGGIEAQKTVNDNTADINPVSQFNTVEIGPEMNIYVPRFLVPFRVKQSKRSNPKTIFTSSFNFQKTQKYSRWITNLSYSYTWKESARKRHTIAPIVINFVKVDLQPSFLFELQNSIHDLYLINSFSDHLSTSTRYTYTYNDQLDMKKLVNFSFFRLNLESSGNILRGIYDVVNKYNPNTFAKDGLGRYTMLDIAYSQYLRTDFDFRYYLNSNEFNKVVFRVAAGIGKPLVNFPTLPFERSFFSGGANGIRAWTARSLGPGSYNDGELFSFGQVGDGMLEANVEYRFKLFKMLNGAFFLDAGNTWLRQPDPARPGADFQFDRFYKEIALGSGVGMRADFSFFIIRFDVGLKVYDPKFAENKRWVIQNLFDPEWKRIYRENNSQRKYNFFTFNLGIGYPF